MNIKGIGTNNIINFYNVNSSNRVKEISKVQKNDTIQISEIAKTLNSYDASDIRIDNTEKIQSIKERLANGTYKVDAKLTAQSIVDAINEGKK